MDAKKKFLIYALVCVNVGLVLALMLGTATPRAEAQGVVGARTDYVVVTCKSAGKYNDVLFILDVREQKLIGLYFDRQALRFRALRGGRELKMDFAAAAE